MIKKIFLFSMLLLSLLLVSCGRDNPTSNDDNTHLESTDKNDFNFPTIAISKTEVTINILNVYDFFDFSVEEDGSIGSIYYFNVGVSKYGGVTILEDTTFTIRVDLEIRYRAANEDISNTKSFHDSVKLTFNAGASNYRDSGRASIDIPSDAIPDGATNIEMNYSYEFASISGKISY